MNLQATLWLVAWDIHGNLVLFENIKKNTLSIGNNTEIRCQQLGKSIINLDINREQKNFILTYKDPGGREAQLTASFGKTLQAGNIYITIMSHQGQSTNHPFMPTDSSLSNAYRTLVQWLAQPMTTQEKLFQALKEWLKILTQESAAQSSMLILSDERGFQLCETFGMPPEQATAIWEKMPTSLSEDILKTGARIILPEEFSSSTPKSKATVFVNTIKSIAGFPILAEERVWGIVYFNFLNIYADLSEERQDFIEASCMALGVILQRAFIREQLLLHQSKTTSSISTKQRLMIGLSQPIQEIYRIIERIAPYDVSTLILGETGTGKELAAREIHNYSPRSRGPLITVNAAALPESLIESELFGHKKGAFTGALSDRAGLIEQAHGGTLFIDEIGELPLAIQVKLLRVLQEKTVVRLGDTKPIRVDFRLVAATHRDLKAMIAEKTFREDLYYRIAAAIIELPPLRERAEDIPLLARYFKDKFTKLHNLTEKEFSLEALDTLCKYNWPGNIRELENTIYRACVMSSGLIILSRDLGINLHLSQKELETQTKTCEEISEIGTLAQAKEAWMRQYILQALRAHNGNRTKTAKALGVGERTLFRYLEQLNIED